MAYLKPEFRVSSMAGSLAESNNLLNAIWMEGKMGGWMDREMDG